MNKIFCIPFFLLLIATGCGFSIGGSRVYTLEEILDSSEVIDISKAVNNFTSSFNTLTEEITIIPLETSEESVLSYLVQIITTSRHIYVLDTYKSGGVAIFSIDGSFIKRLPMGTAPFEIGIASRMYFDRQDSILYVHDVGNNKMMKFSSSGDFISNEYPKASLFIDFAVCNGKYVCVYPSLQTYSKQFSACISDTAETEFYDLGGDFREYMSWPYVASGSKDIFVTKPKDNNVYCFDGQKFFIKYKIVTNKEPDYTDIKTPFELGNKLSSNDFLFEQKFTESFSYQFFQTCSKIPTFIYAARNRKTNQVWAENLKGSLLISLSTALGIGVHDYENNVFNIAIIPSQFLSESSDYRWDGSNPGNLVSEADMEKLRSVKPDDNPIIVLFKLKSDL